MEKTASVVFLTLPVGLYRIVNKSGKARPFGKALVMGKVQLRNPPYPHFAPELAAQMSSCRSQGYCGFAGIGIRIQHAEKRGGMRQIATDVYCGKAHAIEARVLEITTDKLAEDAKNLLPNALATMKFSCHDSSHTSDRARNLDPFVALDLIADFDVVVVAHRDPAFRTGFDLVDVVFEAPQRFQLAFVNHNVVA